MRCSLLFNFIKHFFHTRSLRLFFLNDKIGIKYNTFEFYRFVHFLSLQFLFSVQETRLSEISLICFLLLNLTRNISRHLLGIILHYGLSCQTMRSSHSRGKSLHYPNTFKRKKKKQKKKKKSGKAAWEFAAEFQRQAGETSFPYSSSLLASENFFSSSKFSSFAPLSFNENKVDPSLSLSLSLSFSIRISAGY